MKVLMINSSPKANGNTTLAPAEMEKIFAQEGIELETVQVGHKAVRSCISCFPALTAASASLTMW